MSEQQHGLEMKIWVDADACPVVIKDLLFRAAQRTGVPLTLVSNQSIRIPRSPYIQLVQVASGPDVADKQIVKLLNPGDLVVTDDIPLAARVIEKGGFALTPRGDRYSEENIAERLSMRDFMDALRAGGMETGGPSPLNQKDRNAFANQLDKILTRRKVENGM